MWRKAVLSVFIILTILAIGCGQKQPAASPSSGGDFTRLWSEPSTLDPHLSSDLYSSVILQEVFSGLVSIDRNLKLAPELAESWKESADGKTYSFTLRQNAKFQSGKPVTAQDFKWSLERAADPKTQSSTVDTYLGDIVGVKDKLAGKSQEVSGVKVIDDRTLEITIDAPKAYFISKLTYPTAFVLNRANVESGREWFKTPDGTGPFKLAEYVPGDHILLKRNPDYYQEPAKLDSVMFLLAGGTAMVMYENNEIQITGVGLADLDRVKDPKSPLNKDLHMAPPSFEVSYLGMNVKMPPLDDVKVRQALNLAINKEDIATKALAGLVIPAYGILPPGFPSYNKDLKGLKHDPQKAKQLLSESKYGSDPSKFPRLTLTVPGSMGSSIGPDLEAIIAAWRDVLGINAEIQQVEWATFLKDLHAYRIQMSAVAWGADYPDPQNFLDLLFHSGSVNNETRYSNPEADKLLEAARTERDEKARTEMYQKAEQMIVNDAPWVPLWYSGEGYVLIKPQVKDYILSPMTIPKYRFIYLEK